MAYSPTRRGYQPKVYQPPKQQFAKTHREPDRLIIAPRYEEWLLENPEITANPAVFEKVMRMAVQPPRDRRRSFSASQAGHCLRRQELAFLGARKNLSKDARGVRIFQNGTFGHLRWQINLLSAQIVSGIEVTVKSADEMTRCTLDGIGKAGSGHYKGVRFGWEHKGRMSFAFRSQENNNSPDAKTRKQVAMQMDHSGYEVFTVTNENKDTQEIGEFVIEYDAQEVNEVRKDLKELRRSIEVQKLHPMLPECVKRNSSGEYYKCPYGTDSGSCIVSGNWPKVTA